MTSPDTIVFDDNGGLLQGLRHHTTRPLQRLKARQQTASLESEASQNNPEAFVVLMEIVHANFGHAPLDLKPQDLYNICVLTNKYDMTKTLRPMATAWYQRLKIMCQRSKKMQAYGKTLFVAWELGCQGAVEEMLQDIAEKCHVDEFGSLLIDRNTRLINLEAFRLVPLIDPVAQHRVKMLQVFNAGGKEIAIEILAKRPLCWHTGPCSAVNLADDIPEKFIQATQYLGIDCFFIPSLNADQIRYRGSLSRLHRLFKEVEKLAFGEHQHHPHYRCAPFQRSPFSSILSACYQRLDLILSNRHMEVLVDQACKIEMTAFMGSHDKAILTKTVKMMRTVVFGASWLMLDTNQHVGLILFVANGAHS